MEPLSFNRSTKPQAVEEFVDYYFYRRVAHLMIPSLIRLRLSPNQVTTLSLISGLTGSYLIYQWHFVAGAIACLLAIFFDCCDGQMARLTGKSSPIGRALDGVFDFLWITTLWVIIYLSGILQALGFDNIVWLMVAGGASFMIHCWKFDGLKVKYLELADPSYNEKDMDFHQAMDFAKSEIKRGNPFTTLLGLCVAFQIYFFVRGSQEKKVYLATEAQYRKNREILEPIMSRFSWLGESHHNTWIIIGLFSLPWTPYPLLVAFAFIAGPMNLYFLYYLRLWHQRLKLIPPSMVQVSESAVLP